MEKWMSEMKVMTTSVTCLHRKIKEAWCNNIHSNHPWIWTTTWEMDKDSIWWIHRTSPRCHNLLRRCLCKWCKWVKWDSSQLWTTEDKIWMANCNLKCPIWWHQTWWWLVAMVCNTWTTRWSAWTSLPQMKQKGILRTILSETEEDLADPIGKWSMEARYYNYYWHLLKYSTNYFTISSLYF